MRISDASPHSEAAPSESQMNRPRPSCGFRVAIGGSGAANLRPLDMYWSSSRPATVAELHYNTALMWRCFEHNMAMIGHGYCLSAVNLLYSHRVSILSGAVSGARAAKRPQPREPSRTTLYGGFSNRCSQVRATGSRISALCERYVRDDGILGGASGRRALTDHDEIVGREASPARALVALASFPVSAKATARRTDRPC